VCDDTAPAPKAVTSYEYGAAGGAESLLVKGVAVTADGQTLRTCYSYDNWGRKISETSANASLASCS
jgi:YD repeat-containing protein